MKEAPLRLENLIEKLSKCDPENEVWLDYIVPKKLTSFKEAV